MSLKADPGKAHALREHNSHITRPPHEQEALDHAGGRDVGKELTRELVTDSCLLVAARLPKIRRAAVSG
ncbi:hypothetical protein [Streptomyces sp. BV286]|uniref:hypothetical protein n=1 Tax=Streptomyces sp. BV286 TaxID=2849672 RepID=UPI0035A988A0